MAIAIDNMDGSGLCNKAHCECKPRDEGNVAVAFHFIRGGVFSNDSASATRQVMK